MSRIVAAAVIGFTLGAAASGGVHIPVVGHQEPDDVHMVVTSVSGGGGGGGGGASFGTLCDVLQSGDKVGNWWCVTAAQLETGGAAATSGPAEFRTTWAGFGTPTYADESICSTTERTVYFPTSSQYAQTSTTWNTDGGTSDLSCACVLRDDDQDPSTDYLLTLSDSSAFNGTVAMTGSSASIALVVTDTGGTASNLSSSHAGFTSVTWHTVGFSFRSVGVGTSVATIYIDGVDAGTSGSMNGPLRMSAVNKWAVNRERVFGADLFKARGCFCTGKELLPADHLRIASAVGTPACP